MTLQSAAAQPGPSSASDHWVLSGSLLTDLLPPDVTVLAERSLQNKVFSQKREFLHLLQRGILQWCKFNGLPSIPKSQIQDLGSTLWSSHISHLTNHITCSSIQNLEQLFPGAVIHCEDKHASSVRIFCPCCTIRQLRRHFWTGRSLVRSMTLPKTSPQPWSINSIANRIVPIPGLLGRDANSLQATFWPRRKRTLKVVVPLFHLWTPPYAPC